MIEYKGQLNMGNEALGSEKTITANEVVRTCDMKALARETVTTPSRVATVATPQATLKDNCNHIVCYY